MKLFRSSLIGLVAVSALLVSTAGLAKNPSNKVTIVDVASAVNEETGEFSTLLFAAGLYPDIVAYLQANGQRTLFAPTDEAFGKLNAILPMFCYNDVLDLAGQQPAYVGEVLAYHVAKGRLDASEVLPKDQIRMLTGDFVTRVPQTTVITDALGRDATLEILNVFAGNGVIHGISEVILPYAPPTGTSCP